TRFGDSSYAIYHLDAHVLEGGANRLESPIHTSYARERTSSNKRSHLSGFPSERVAPGPSEAF
ncbi:hypothetical protein GIB67_022774, partial [Kingdonia uniflora]